MTPPNRPPDPGERLHALLYCAQSMQRALDGLTDALGLATTQPTQQAIAALVLEMSREIALVREQIELVRLDSAAALELIAAEGYEPPATECCPS